MACRQPRRAGRLRRNERNGRRDQLRGLPRAGARRELLVRRLRPCRAEAPDLQALHEQYDGNGAAFLGVNVRDQADTATSFANTYGITYPSIIDTDAAVALAFSGKFAANAVPTTLVLDVDGRPAARILGRVTARSILDTLIADTIAEAAS
ncbi:TlpA family protein disulfide reductase [Rathayibacter sp. Leaf299]|uniref:TlpA family protein disulfide reductase n=1 Tax=Rathayibacter sp. Leaf299 TaxID=1736328 RepID=UPI000AC0E0A1